MSDERGSDRSIGEGASQIKVGQNTPSGEWRTSAKEERAVGKQY